MKFLKKLLNRFTAVLDYCLQDPSDVAGVAMDGTPSQLPKVAEPTDEEVELEDELTTELPIKRATLAGMTAEDKAAYKREYHRQWEAKNRDQRNARRKELRKNKQVMQQVGDDAKVRHLYTQYLEHHGNVAKDGIPIAQPVTGKKRGRKPYLNLGIDSRSDPKAYRRAYYLHTKSVGNNKTSGSKGYGYGQQP